LFRSNQSEGASSEGKNVVVIEDLISTGGSSITAVDALKAAGANVLGVVAIFTYGLKKADDQFTRADIPFYTLSNYNELIEVARENGEISENDITTLVDWRDNLS